MDERQNSQLPSQLDPHIQRRSGVLLHPTSLPNKWGIGDLGPEAYGFVDSLHSMHQRLWQVLPLGPPAMGGSPYSSLSSVAGNPLLISLDLLARGGLLDSEDTEHTAPSAPVDFDRASALKLPRLRAACDRFLSTSSNNNSLAEFCRMQSEWLDDYALFMAVKDAERGAAWNQWPASLMNRRRDALRQARKDLQESIAYHQFTQYTFFKQWFALRAYANERGINVVGDIPFYVALDSADVWSEPSSFAIDRKSGEARMVAGVPPDYFSPTGQRWDAPVYDWKHLQESGFAWWVSRFRKLLQLVDVIRIDHFRGFAAYWQVPRNAETAADGEWIEAPGAALFTTLRDQLGDLPIWAEDLGLITEDVEALRRQFGFPGMKVLQFAFDEKGAANPYLPFHYDSNCVCYTATHDNDTTRGWWAQLDRKWKRAVTKYLGSVSGRDVHWSMIRLAMSCVANDVVIPFQDVLGLGSEGRLNVPGQAEGNWSWRFDPQTFTSTVRDRMLQLTKTYGRSHDSA